MKLSSERGSIVTRSSLRTNTVSSCNRQKKKKKRRTQAKFQSGMSTDVGHTRARSRAGYIEFAFKASVGRLGTVGTASSKCPAALSCSRRYRIIFEYLAYRSKVRRSSTSRCDKPAAGELPRRGERAEFRVHRFGQHPSTAN